MNQLTIVIPTYERPEFLAECLATVEAQTRKSFDLVVLNNGSTRNYDAVLERFSGLGIEYICNASNIGGGPNLVKARQICERSQFGMVFHDDDLMHPRLVEWELGILEAQPDIAWVAGECCPFPDGSRPPVELWDRLTGRPEIYRNRATLLRRIFEGSSLNYGSTMLRNSVSKAVVEQIERFHIVSDRPYLLDIAKLGNTALIREPLVLYRLHATQGSYDPHFMEDHAIELMGYYRDILPMDLDPEDKRLFLKHSTNYLLHAHSFTRPENRDPFWTSVSREQAAGLFRWRSVDGQGVAALASIVGLGWAFSAMRPVLSAAKRMLRR